MATKGLTQKKRNDALRTILECAEKLGATIELPTRRFRNSEEKHANELEAIAKGLQAYFDNKAVKPKAKAKRNGTK